MSNHTKGPWELFIDDSGGEFSGWPLSITAPSVHQDCVIVRTGGQWPYSWDYAISQKEAISNALLITASPIMYDALKAALPFLEDNYRFLRDMQAHAGRINQAFNAVEAVRSAIELADGK